MSEQDNDQKTEQPTAKRKADAVKEGDLLQSKDFGAALVMIGGAGWLMVAGPWFVQSSMEILRQGLTINRADVTNFDPARQILALLRLVIMPLGALAGISMFAAIAGPAALGSLGFRTGNWQFKGNRISPMSGLKRIFGMNGPIELCKSIAKAGLLGFIGYRIIARDMPLVMGLVSRDLTGASQTMGHSLVTTVLTLSIGLLVIAGIDVPAQLFQRNARLRMTKQEIKEEMRQSEGSPELKQAIRQRQHDILRGSARQAVTEATVVLTNPTHFAVALRYRPGIDAEPIVVARGRDEIALAIRGLATKHKVPILEYPQLTRAIYFTARAGQPIAEDLYLAVATILAFVFNLERTAAETPSQPSVFVPEEKHFDEHGKRQVH